MSAAAALAELLEALTACSVKSSVELIVEDWIQGEAPLDDWTDEQKRLYEALMAAEEGSVRFDPNDASGWANHP